MKLFTTKQMDDQNPRNRNPRIHKEKDIASPSIPFFPGNGPGAIVEVLAEDESWVTAQADELVNVLRVTGLGSPDKGWMRRGHIDAPTELKFELVPKEDFVEDFVKACARQELLATTGDDPTHAIQADYLIALALIETGL